MLRVVTLTAIAMFAFAANSVLVRLALIAGDANALGYTGVRLASGAAVLALLLVLSDRRTGTRFVLGGSWSGAGALFGYALAFSVAYVMLGAGTGALVLFAAVQLGILSWGIFKGDRPRVLEWLGIAIALASLLYLVAPGLVAPPLPGVALMVIAGLCWAAYTLIGRGSRSPLVDSAGNFVRCLPVSLVLLALGDLPNMSLAGLSYAIASGALASGLGYAVWYAVLPSHSRPSAAFVQLTVPAIAAAGGVLLIGEPITARLMLASAGILGGVALSLAAAERRKSASPK